MVRRYGDFVLYNPPFKPLTWLLWLGPFLLLCAGALVLARVVARRRAMRPPQLSADERRRADALLNRTSEDCGP
jgi:cytochrome c-type biogenesis protein CcmH